jgi:hypothetical protein
MPVPIDALRESSPPGRPMGIIDADTSAAARRRQRAPSTEALAFDESAAAGR